MAEEIERLVIDMDVKLNRIDKQLKKAAGTVDKSMKRMEDRTNRAARTMNGAFSSLRATAGALGVYLGADQVRRYADSWTLVQNQITATEQLIGIQLKSREQLLDLASRSRSDLQATTQLYTRVAASINHLTQEESDYAKITETVAKALKLGGATAQEQASAMLQLSQAFNKGKLDGDEFRSVAENARIIIQGLAEQLGVTRGEIIKMAGDGKLTVDQLVASLLKIAPQVDAAFAKTNATIAQSITELNNKMTEYIGNLAETTGLAEATRAVMYALAGNIEMVGDSALVAGAYILGAFGPQAIAAVGRFGVALAASTGGLTALTGGLAAAMTAYALFGDQIRVIDGDHRTLQDYGGALWDVLAEHAGDYGTLLESKIIPLINDVSNALSNTESEGYDAGKAIRNFANLTIGMMAGAVEAIKAAVANMPAAVVEGVINLVNKMLSAIEAGINGAIGLLNKFSDAVNDLGGSVGLTVGQIAEVQIGRLENDFVGSGKKLGEALQNGILSGLGTDYIGKALEELRQRIDDKNVGLPVLKPRDPAGTVPGKPKGDKTDTAEKLNALDKQIARIKKRTALLVIEAETLNKSAYEAEKARAAFRLLEAAKQANVPLTDELRQRIEALAGGYAAASVELDAMKEAQADAAARAAALEDSFQSATKSIVQGLVEGRDAADLFADALSNIADRLLDLALDDVFKSLKGGGGGGGFLGNLFGGGGGGLLGGAIIPGILHSGGVAGRDGYGHGRAVSAGVFNGAPRYHNGGIAGLKPDEVPAILQRGEVVLPRGANAKGSGVTIAPTYNIDARGAGENVDAKLAAAMRENNEQLKRDLPGMIRNEQARGRV